MRYAFGKNWESFIAKNFSEERVMLSKQRLLDFLGCSDLEGKSFLDIGCGSGLHSLAAFRCNAKKIVSFDFDHTSVSTTQKLRNQFGDDRWTVFQGSILDDEILKKIEPADIVYSWGVLHHTGNMWKAIENALSLVAENGVAFIALYDYDVQIDPTPEFWLNVKQRYNRSGILGQRWMELWYIWRFSLGKRLWAIPGFLRTVMHHKSGRGMAYYTDVKDWLGGWPMEFAKVEDVKLFALEKFNMETVRLVTGEANAEFLLKHRAARVE